MNQENERMNEPRHEVTASVDEAIALAVQLHQVGRLEEAEGIYRQILNALPDHVDALHFLGVLSHQHGRGTEAVKLIRRALSIDPNHADACNNLGNVLKEQGNLEEAEGAYRKVLVLRPRHADAHNNLGTVLRDQQQFEAAVEAYEKAIELDPQHADAYHNLGNVLKRLDRVEGALTAYRKAIELRPYRTHAYDSLGKALYRAGRINEAIGVYQQWLKNESDNPIAQHMLAACTGENVPDRASDDYVREVFDSFAGSFNEVLARLDYRAPQLIEESLAREIPHPSADLDVLDAGCGTGLCGPILRTYAQNLIGVDLSPAMIAKSHGLDLYDDLQAVELTTYLRGSENRFDLIASADTLVYFGRLEDVFDAVSKALRHGGRIFFTLERHRNAAAAGHCLEAHGRYSHTTEYVSQTLREAALEVVSIQSVALRKESGRDVNGMLVVARRS